MTALSRDVEIALAAAGAGAATVRAAYGGAPSIHAKSGIDFATNADIESERAILDVITAALPDDTVEGEETDAGAMALRPAGCSQQPARAIAVADAAGALPSGGFHY